IGPALKRGDGSFNMHSDVVATIQKQPNANTLEVTSQIESALAALKPTLPGDVTIETRAFQQAAFIDRAISNLQRALAEGGLLVTVVLFLFLWNFRTTFISLMAIPLSMISAVIALTVTPALCYYLLGNSRFLRETGDSALVRWLKRRYSTTLQWTLRYPVQIIGVSAAMLAIAVMVFPLMGREFLPPFNEGSLNIN